MNFETAIAHVLKSEGGYTDNPNDRGNWTGGARGSGELKGTKFGISAASYPTLNIRQLTRAQAVAIYRRDFWDALKCDRLPARLRLAYFDAAVNTGPGNAARFLQEAVGVAIDGAVGPKTLLAVSRRDAAQLLEDFMWLRARHHARLARNTSSQREFLPGWILRLIQVRRESASADI